MLFLVCHKINTGALWTMLQPGKHAINLVVRPLQQGLHRTVFQVAHPAFHALQMRMTYCSGPKTHALDMTAYGNEQGFKIMFAMQCFDRRSPEP